jgi:ABC-type amino acid transport substrate-binding protein
MFPFWLFPQGVMQTGVLPKKPSDDPLQLAVPDKLIVGTREVPPFAMRSQDNQWVGLSIDLLREVQTALENESGHDIEIEFRVLPLAELLDAVEASEVDLAAAAITVNYEREKRLDFTHSFHTSGLFIIAGFTAAVTSTLTLTELRSQTSGPADLSRAKVATVAGSTSEQYLRSRHIKYEKYTDVVSALQSLVANRCDAVVYDAPILKHFVYQQHSGAAFVLPVTFERQDYAFAIPANSPLRELINQVLLRQTSSPDWKEVLATYFGEDQE